MDPLLSESLIDYSGVTAWVGLRVDYFWNVGSGVAIIYYFGIIY